jgi:hypothetical protein
MGRLAVAVLLPLVTGWLLVGALWPASGRGVAWLVLRLSLAIGLGLGVSSCALFVVLLVAGPSRGGAIAADVALLAGALVWLLLARRPSRPPVAGGEAPAARAPAWLVAAVGVLALTAVAHFALESRRVPHGEWDAWAVWNLRARFLVHGGTRWQDALSPLIGWSHPDYPLLLPASVARVWLHVRRDVAAGPAAIAALFTTATVALAIAAPAVAGGSWRALVTALLVLGGPALVTLGASQYADVPQAFFVLAPLALLCVVDHRPGPERARVLALAGVLGGLGAWVKNEGTLALLALLAARVAVVGLRAGAAAAWRDLRPMLLGLAPIAVIVGYHRWALAPPGYLLAGQTASSLAGRLVDPARYATILRGLGQELWHLGGWITGVAVLATAAALLGMGRPGRAGAGPSTAALALAVTLLGVLGVYLVTPLPLEWQVGTSLGRLLLQLWPSAALVYGLCIRPPHPSLSAGGGGEGEEGKTV